MTDEPQQDEELTEGTLLSHLIELRSRLVKMAAAVIVLFAVLLPFNQRIFELVSKPLLAAVPSGQMIITGAAAPLLVPFKLTFLVALFLAMPVVLYQLWAFVAPGLYRKEKRFALPLVQCLQLRAPPVQQLIEERLEPSRVFDGVESPKNGRSLLQPVE